MTGAHEVIVVGGGVIGCGIAWELTRRNVRVTLVERGPIGREASWASAGIISLPNRPDWRPERIALGRLSLKRYPEWVADLESRTGIAIEYHRPGGWSVAVDAEHGAVEAERAAFQLSLGFEVEEVAPEEARRREPALPRDLVAAWFTPAAGSLSLHRLTEALAAAAAAQGAVIRPETPVGSILMENGRAVGVRLSEGDLLADRVVLATGAWTRLLADPLGVALPTRPMKGQLIAFANAPVHPRGIISGHHGYVRPRPDGSTLVAATEEDVGFDHRVTGEGVAWLLNLTRMICPGLLAGEIVETWAGLRPGSDTGEPMMGPVPGVDGLWAATGHFRTGAKEAPASAMLMAEALATSRIDPLLAAFAPPATSA